MVRGSRGKRTRETQLPELQRFLSRWIETMSVDHNSYQFLNQKYISQSVSWSIISMISTVRCLIPCTSPHPEIYNPIPIPSSEMMFLSIFFIRLYNLSVKNWVWIYKAYDLHNQHHALNWLYLQDDKLTMEEFREGSRNDPRIVQVVIIINNRL